MLTASALALVAACGDDGEPVSVIGTDSAPTTAVVAATSAPSTAGSTTPETSAPETPAPTTSVSDAATVGGVVVAQGYGALEPDAPHWWVVDLADGTRVEGSARLLVEVPRDGVGCGEALFPYGAWRIETGAAVTFAITDEPTGTRPTVWGLEGDSTFASEPAVHARSFWVECPEGTAAITDELAAQRLVWDERGPDSYEFSMTWHVFNNAYGDYRIGVADGAAVSVMKDGTTRLDPDTLAGLMPVTIDEVFDELARHAAADAFDADYHPELGFPVRVEVDEMLDATDDELEVRITDVVAGEPAPVVEQAPEIGQRLDASVLNHSLQQPEHDSVWLIVDLADGFTIDGSARVIVQVPLSELRCGEEGRPVDSLDTLFDDGPPTVSFELVALDGEPWPPPGENSFAGPTVTGRQLHIAVCPPTTEERLAELTAARARWAAAGIDDYEMDVRGSWSQAGLRHRITVVDGVATSIVTVDEFDEPGPPETDPAVLAAVPTTVEAVFDWLAATIPVEEELEVHYDPVDGHPGGAYGGAIELDVNLRLPGEPQN